MVPSYLLLYPSCGCLYNNVMGVGKSKCLVDVHAFPSAPTQMNAHKHNYENQ